MSNDIMNNDADFLIANYTDSGSSYSNANYKARDWIEQTGKVLIRPSTPTLEDLENDWISFNSMIKKHRRESDWKSIELFGMTNQTHYEKLRNAFLSNDIPNEIESNEIDPITESYIDSDNYYSKDAINYTSVDVDKAREWADESNKTIIIPTRTLAELEELWDAYNMMIKKHKRESDWTSMELFGVTNLKHYEYLKAEFLKEDIRSKDVEEYGSLIEGVTLNKSKRYYTAALSESSVETAGALLEKYIPKQTVYEELITNNVVSDVLDKYDAGVINPADSIDAIGYGDLPFMSPEEMIDLGVFGQSPAENYYGIIADNSDLIEKKLTVQEWFNIYRNASKGVYTEYGTYASDWVNKVRELSYGLERLKESGDEKAILARKQSLLELGWNPEIPFSAKSRLLAREMGIMRMKSTFSGSKYRVINLKEFTTSQLVSKSINESAKDGYKPVYIAMIEGKSYFSKAIKALTKDIYSHVAISFDPDLHEMYSYGIQTNDVSDRSGFRKEHIKDLPIGGRLGVYTFFVSDKVYKKIVDFVEKFKENAEKTSYSYRNLITYLFNIPYNMEWKLVCSQFVDKCLQAADINLTGKDSSQISPSDLNKVMLKDSRIYNVYEGLASKYDSSKIKNLVDSLSRKAKPLKETSLNIQSLSEAQYLGLVLNNINNVNVLFEMQEHVDIVTKPQIKRILNEMVFDPINIRPIGEAKEFPIQFDKEGNLIIKNLKKLDYEAEYAKSHKLLKEYDKSKNYEGMKYELSKMWMMICTIEGKIHGEWKDKPSFAIASSSAHKARAKLINDLNYYMKKVMDAEPDFNFSEYFESSPFSSGIKINRPTIQVAAQMIKQFLRSI